jgi:hypothetical protein
MEGYKHLIECHCVLPQFRKMENPVFHKFVVFSELDDEGNVVPKLSQCNNCGAIHKVVDICISEIAPGKDETRSVLTKNDVARSLPKQLVELLEEYQLEVADYEFAKFIIENQKWGSLIVLSKESEEEGGFAGKTLNFVGPEKYRVDPYFTTDTV